MVPVVGVTEGDQGGPPAGVDACHQLAQARPRGPGNEHSRWTGTGSHAARLRAAYRRMVECSNSKELPGRLSYMLLPSRKQLDRVAQTDDEEPIAGR